MTQAHDAPRMTSRALNVRDCRGRNAASTLVITAVMFSAGAAFAEAPAPAADAPNEVREVIVTAQKRSERIQDVPISISVVNTELLQSTNAKNLTELSGAVPGVQFNGNGGGGRTYLSLRGTTGSALNTGDEPVAIYLDDVYLARGVAIGAQDLVDVGSIEVVRGPQGTLQGRNATAGAILIRSADPTANPEGYITAELQDPLEGRVQGAISGPLGGGWEGRLSAGFVDSRGWGKNTFDNSRVGIDKSGQVRGVLTYKGDSPLTARIAVDYSSVSNVAALFRGAETTFSALPTGVLVVNPTPTVPLTPAEHDRIYNHNEYSLNPNTHTTVNTDGVAAKLQYAFDGVDLVSVTGARHLHVFGENNSGGLGAGAGTRIGYNFNNDRSNEFSEEVRLQSSGKTRFSWILGGYYFYENQDYGDTIYNQKFTTPTSTASFYSGNQKTHSWAAFADGTFNITDQLQLIGGIRYTTDKKLLTASIAVTNLDTLVVTNTPYAPPEASWSDTTYRAKLVYHPTSNLMLFVGYGTGFRAGGYNDFAVQVAFAPETNKSLEAGVKGDAFDRRLSFSFTAYRNDYQNLQLRAGVPSGGAIITNAANSVIKGFEFETTLRPEAHTRLSFNTSYTDAKFTSFPQAVDIFNHFVDASGNTLPNAPKWQFFVSAAHDWELSSGWQLTAEANYRWRDKIYFYFTNQTDIPWSDKAGGSLNARISLRSADDKWTIAAYGSNITNARIVTTDVITFSYPELGLNPPRAFGISVERRF
jgi:iron complex outermembrane receptor protein